MLEWPTPKTLKGLRGFLGLTGYYRKFIHRYANIAFPLTQQLKKDSFKWNEEAQEAFEALKQIMTTTPVLRMPNFSLPFEVEADASGYGLGAVLMQQKHPIAYYSRTLGPRGRSKPIYEKELMAIVFAIQKWRHYLMGSPFVIWTDQISLKWLMEQREVGTEYQKWVMKLMGYIFEIRYKPGASNKVADALSRQQGDELECGALISVSMINWAELEKEIQEDEEIQAIVHGLMNDTGSFPGYHLDYGRLWYKGRRVIPPTSTTIPKLIFEYHNSGSGGHNGELKTYLRIASGWFWRGMRNQITQYVRECNICQQQKVIHQHPAGLLQPLPIPTQVWDEITMDFVEALPKAGGWDTILVVVDRLTKYAHFVGLKHPFTAQSIAGIFVK